MPHYYFDVRNGGNTLDDTGTDLPDLDAARAEAIGILSDLVRQFPPDGSLMENEVVVRAEDGSRVLKAILTFQCIALAEDNGGDLSVRLRGQAPR